MRYDQCPCVPQIQCLHIHDSADGHWQATPAAAHSAAASTLRHRCCVSGMSTAQVVLPAVTDATASINCMHLVASAAAAIPLASNASAPHSCKHMGCSACNAHSEGHIPIPAHACTQLPAMMHAPRRRHNWLLCCVAGRSWTCEHDL
jgi:hypothetical protein